MGADGRAGVPCFESNDSEDEVDLQTGGLKDKTIRSHPLDVGTAATTPREPGTWMNPRFDYL